MSKSSIEFALKYGLTPETPITLLRRDQAAKTWQDAMSWQSRFDYRYALAA